MRKIVRFINRIVKEKLEKKSKPIKYESILRVIEIAEEEWEDYPEIKGESEGNFDDNVELREMIFSLILFPDENRVENITELIKKIHQFNLKTRCFGIKKRKLPKVKAK